MFLHFASIIFLKAIYFRLNPLDHGLRLYLGEGEGNVGEILYSLGNFVLYCNKTSHCESVAFPMR